MLKKCAQTPKIRKNEPKKNLEIYFLICFSIFPIFWGGSGGEIYTVFDEESESAVRIDEFLHPEEKIKKNQN